MKVWHSQVLSEVIVIEPDVFEDQRGYFSEAFQKERYQEAGIKGQFVQDNLSFSQKGVLRGLHYQYPHQQAKLVFVVHGEIFDVAVDIRDGSPTFGKWTSVVLSSENHRQLYIPKGFAHGFCVLSDTAVVIYKCDEYYFPEDDGGIIWSDPELGIDWPLSSPILSAKDKGLPRLKEIPPSRLPSYLG